MTDTRDGLTVVVPCHDVETYVGQTLTSLARNVDERVHVVLVDDASTDGTPALLARAADALPRTRVVTLTTNQGLSAARNAGTAAAGTRYLTFLDGDDVLVPGHLVALLEAIERLGCDFVRTDHVQVHGERRQLRRVAHGPRDVVCDARAGIGAAGHQGAVDSPNAWAGVYDRARLPEHLLRFDEDLRTCEDRPWVWRLHLEAETFAAVGLRGVRYRRAVEGSLSHRRDAKQLDFLVAMERIVAMVANDPARAPYLAKAVRSTCAMVCWHLEHLSLYTPQLREELWRRSAALLARLPQAELGATVRAVDRTRARTLATLGAAA